ncbi:unnamed protein product [Zymoseptoria tritici ST99CH_1A5]|uniref:Uncharacterized protein n=3 Tax=Zymoseptoria tritici TaxID=1047171 RepID=A0A1X7RFX7_ZYMT9|nr:unnamed protein product [Zymoseptoria tritici ST99CH_3D7]SMR42660.1 unnamed protein product [Zymoseptoria tritici ST99CH_1E4]SMR44835.1 unnamed protein product [Zymoseptoria tritici ST99CH_3D1]SMY20000.1 unnamed protein product [Zymoseptoria tritici ST99CH_1A5]
MQFTSLFAIPALALFASAAPTSADNMAVEKRADTAGLASMLIDLTNQVKAPAAAMKATADSVPADASEEQKNTAAQSVVANINEINEAIKATNAQMSTMQKRSLEARQSTTGTTLADLPKDVLGQLNGNPIIFANLLLTLVRELDPAVTSVLRTLNLNATNVALQPLLKVQLPALVVGLGNLVNGLVIALAPLLVGLDGILAPLLAGLGL